MEYVLQTNSLTKKYKHFKALSELSMNVPKGAIYGFVGKNGAGKTTLIRLICGLQFPTSGGYTLYGRKDTDKDISKSRRRMGAVVETPSIYLDMTAQDNLKQQYSILGLPSYDGMQDILKLDEPVNGLDPQGIIEMRELILKLNREQQITFLISSHILDELSRLATHYGFIDRGQMVREISAADLESACRKCIRLEVTDTGALARVLDGMEVEYRIVSDREADVYAKVNVSRLTLALAEENCEVISMQERDESLESYYISLIGGQKND